MFKLLPLGRSEREPVPSIHHQAEGKREKWEKQKKGETGIKRGEGGHRGDG